MYNLAHISSVFSGGSGWVLSWGWAGLGQAVKPASYSGFVASSINSKISSDSGHLLTLHIFFKFFSNLIEHVGL